MKNAFLLLLLFVGIACNITKEPTLAEPLTVEADILLQQVNIIDVVHGEILPNRSVAIQANKIIGIYKEIILPSKTTKIINGQGQYLIPGLWDMHTHYNWNYTFSNPLLIANGITGIREMWGEMDTIEAIREQVAAGNMIAPDIFSAGNIIDGTPPIWPGTAGVSDAKEAVAQVDSQITEGVDFLKVYSLLKKDTYHAIAKRSKATGVPFAGHVPDAVSIWEAIDANQQSVEHMYGVLEACTADPDSLATFTGWEIFSPVRTNLLVDSFDPILFDSLANKLANSTTWLSPTLSVLKQMATLDDTTKMQDARMAYMPAYFHYMWNPKNDFRLKFLGPEDYRANKRKFNLDQSLVGKFAKAGGKIIAGTDYSNPFCFPGFSLHDELGLLVEGGLSPAEALKAATYHPAVFMKKEKEFGQVQEGQLASLVLLEKNPLENIAHTKSIQGVFLRGQYFDRNRLDGMLEEAKEIAANTEAPVGN